MVEAEVVRLSHVFGLYDQRGRDTTMLNLDGDIVLTVTQTKSSIQNQLYESMRLGTIPKGRFTRYTVHGNHEIPVNFQQERVSKKSDSHA